MAPTFGVRRQDAAFGPGDMSPRPKAQADFWPHAPAPAPGRPRRARNQERALRRQLNMTIPLTDPFLSTPRIYADFNNADSKGRLRLITEGSLSDIKRQNLKMEEGMLVVVYDDELSASAEVTFSEEEKIWVAKIDWAQIKR